MRTLFSGNHAMVSLDRTLYTLIRRQGPVTRQFLCQELSQPATTVSRSLERLIHSGLILETGLADSSGGRRPILYQTAGSSFYLFGLDLTSSPARLVLTDLHLQAAGTSRIEWPAGLAADSPDILTDACAALLEQNQASREKVLGLGICLPDAGDVEPEYSEMIDQLTANLQMPVFQAEIPQALVSRARWRSNEPAGDSFLRLNAGQAICLDLFLNGQLPAANRLPGQSGQMIVPAPDKYSGSGFGATLDELAAQASLLCRFQRAKDDTGLTWSDFCQAVQAGKRKSSQILQEAATAMAIAVSNACLLTGCGSLLLDGTLWQEVPEAVIAMLDALTVIRSAAMPELPQLQIFPPDTDMKAAGAAALVLDHYLGANQ